MIILSEKYRPKKVDDMILSKDIKDRFNEWIDKDTIDHLLFIGKPGTGKTTISRILVDKIDSTCLELNASDERGIQTIRNKVKSFAMTMSNKPLKIVFLDEADYLTLPSQAMLRTLIEKYSKFTRFILTANYKNKIIPAIKSRCQIFEFVYPEREQIKNRLTFILNNEKIVYDDKSIDVIIDKFYPDIRKCINTIQKFNIKGNLRIDKLTEKTVYEQILISIDKRNIIILRELLQNSDVDYVESYRFLFDYFLKNEKNKIKRAKLLLKISDYLYKNSLVADPMINFMALGLDIIKILGEDNG